LVLFSGTYIPQKEVEVIEEIQATVIMTNEALKLRALMETKDRDGNTRVAGEEWLVKRVGAYLPGVHEEIVDVVQARVLTETVCMNRYLLCYTFLDFVFVIQRYV
jgi:major vault protein